MSTLSAKNGLSPEMMRRITLRIIPFILGCYLISFLDRVNVAFAALQMNRDLGFTKDVYGFGAGLFFLTYCVFEVPSNLALYRFGARRWIARIMLVWGIVAAGMAFVTGPMSFYVMRLLLGAAEAGVFQAIDQNGGRLTMAFLRRAMAPPRKARRAPIDAGSGSEAKNGAIWKPGAALRFNRGARSSGVTRRKGGRS